MRNCYKREDVFACRHEMHRKHAYRVSAYHVLCRKRCFPHGCLDFLWKCKLLDKGGTCPKGYRHVGNNCTWCRHYTEEKIHRYPELLLDEDAYRQFLDQRREMDEWLEDHEGRLLEVGGRVTDVRPHLLKRVSGRRTALRLRGFLVRLAPAYVGRTGFQDPIYFRLSGAQQRRCAIAPGDALEAEGRVQLDRGRLIVARPRRLHVEERSGNPPASWDQAILDRIQAVSLRGQPERCLQCERGVLVDVEDDGLRRRGPRREMLCLEGIGRPAECPYEARRTLREGVPV